VDRAPLGAGNRNQRDGAARYRSGWLYDHPESSAFRPGRMSTRPLATSTVRVYEEEHEEGCYFDIECEEE